jgi:hypothetical protein
MLTEENRSTLTTTKFTWARQGVKLDFRSKEPATNFLNYDMEFAKMKFVYHNKRHYFAIKIKILFFLMCGRNCQRRGSSSTCNIWNTVFFQLESIIF